MPAEAPPTEFPVARCEPCDKDVLCYLELDEDGRERVRCLDCSLGVDLRALRWLDLHDLEDLGYGYVIPEGGCGRPDCGRGQCGRSQGPLR